MNYTEEITRLHPIRRTAEQKKAFREWTVQEIKHMGYSVKVEQNGRIQENIIVGNPETAPMLFTAHYDTAANMLLPNVFLPRNPLVYLLYNVLLVVLMLCLAAVLMLALGAVIPDPKTSSILWIAAYFGLLLWLTFGGIPNKNNVNDNTSGVAALLTMMSQLPEEHRAKAAFILFDNEEKGQRGSKAYAKEHLQVGYTRLTVNLNCVGVGENLLVISRKLARQHREFTYLQRHLEQLTTHKAFFFDSLGTAIGSDWKSFKCGVNLCTCKHSKLWGFYTPHLHTNHDTTASKDNITALAAALTACVEELTT